MWMLVAWGCAERDFPVDARHLVHDADGDGYADRDEIAHGSDPNDADDGIYAGARLLEILGRTGKTIAELLADLPPSYSTPEIRIDCPDDVKFRVADGVRDHFRAEGRELIDTDGVRVKFPHGWGLLRASNTQPVLVLRFEATTPEELAEYRRTVEDVVSKVRAEVGG